MITFRLFLTGLALSFMGLAIAQQPLSKQYVELRDKAYEQLVSGKFDEAEKSFRKALDLYDQDGQVWLSYGQTASKNGHFDEGISAGHKVLELGAFGAKVKSQALFEMACAFCGKKDITNAWQALEQSMAAGFRSLDQVRKEPRLESLHTNPKWTELSATRDLSKVSRNEGWQYDLWLLDRELRRIHIAPYRTKTEQERNTWVRQIHDQIPSLTDEQVTIEFMRYVASFNDGHTRISVPGLPRPRLQLFLFEDGLYVLSAHSDHKDLVGKRLIEVEGRPVESLFPQLESIVFKDNPQGIQYSLPTYILNPVILRGIGVNAGKDKLNLTFLSEDGKKETLSVPCSPDFMFKPDWAVLPKAQEVLTLKNRSKNYWFEYLPDLKAMYIQYNAVMNDKDEPLAVFSERLFKQIDANKIENLILDVRWNGGGNTFLSQPLINALQQRPKISQGRHFYVITGRNTFSAAQNFTTDLARSTQAIFVGEPTGSSPNFIGESIPFSLPYSKLAGTISDLYWQRSWPMDERIWIAPDLPAIPNIKAFLAGKDPAMEAIIADIKS